MTWSHIRFGNVDRCIMPRIGMTFFVLLFLLLSRPSSAASDSILIQENTKDAASITIFTFAQDHPIARKQKYELEQQNNHVVSLTLEEQAAFVREHCGNDARVKFQSFVQQHQEQLAVELWKYCALNTSKNDALYVDSSSPLLAALSDILAQSTTSTSSIAVLGDSYITQTIHGSFLLIRKEQSHVAASMLQLLLETPIDTLTVSPLLIPRTLYALIAQDATDKKLTAPGLNNKNTWYLLEQLCHLNAHSRGSTSSSVAWTDTNSYRLAHHCPEQAGFCCFVQDATQVVLMSRHPLLPYQVILQVLKPLNAEASHYQEHELPYIATIRQTVYPKDPQDDTVSPNFFDVLLQNNCLPSSDSCTKCLREKSGANCHSCASVCECYCRALCHETAQPKRVSKQLTVSPPQYSRDPNRLIPRVVHQTWFETLNPDKYPNMSRLVESFKRSGWEYRFYSDSDAANFLSTHFSGEVREAYDALKPGAFKADLFRYCVLLIHGGVYADVDILLESALDFSVPPDVGFMVPMDEPGAPVNKRMCLWNGLIAAAPGHVYLTQAIETVVNSVRNRFTAVDTDATFCPDPELSILHAFDTLFTAGPCLLGASINRVLGRHPQTPFRAGELDTTKTAYVVGRTIILAQGKFDMGAHRFTNVQQNLVVAATDLPDSNDRANLESKSTGQGGGEHYSKTHARTGIYGLEGLYVDKRQANEDIRIVLDTSNIVKNADRVSTVA